MERPVNRRDFLGSVAAISAGVAATAYAWPQAPAREQLGAQHAPDGKPLKAGLIGRVETGERVTKAGTGK